MSASRLFLATDYGLDDEFVGVLHAVIARVSPEVRVIDLAHGIVAFDVAGGAALLARAAPHLGDGVLCAVVDPGVGSARRAVALEVRGTGPRHLVGPDNGLLLDAAGCLGGVERAIELASDAPGRIEHTFDGRDVFAPNAARLAAGAPLESLGALIDPSTLVRLPRRTSNVSRALDDGRTVVTTEVVWIDRFGNVQLALSGEVLADATTVGLVVGDDDALARVVRAYADLVPGALGVLRDANGAVALVVREGSAARRIGVKVGDRLELVGFFGPLP